jgi:hypothetical protein
VLPPARTVIQQGASDGFVLDGSVALDASVLASRCANPSTYLDARGAASNKELRLLSYLLNRSAQAFFVPPAGMDYDLSLPVGEAALVPADSVTWRIFKNPLSLYIGGVAAVILELAEPAVCAGVWEHSSFRRDPLTRLRRTGFAALVTVYGARSIAERMIRGVVKAHDRVQGTTAQGAHYRANDPRLLDWVQATRRTASSRRTADSSLRSTTARSRRVSGGRDRGTSLRRRQRPDFAGRMGRATR